MSEINKQQQAAVASQTTPQQTSQQTQVSQQQVEGATMQVQITHDGSEHMQAAQVASSNTTMNPSSTMVMAAPQQALIPQQAMQNLQNPPTIAPMPSQGGSTTITTMSTGPPQQVAEWPGPGRVQVIQQPIQNPTYIQPVYNAQGQLIVPSNIAVHPGDMNQPIQVIAAGKAFQPGQMPHMLATAQGKQIVQGQATPFPGYATIPTSGSNQTLVISQLGVLGQTNILPQQQGKPQNMQKMITKTNVTTNNIKASPAPQQSVSIGNLVSSQPQGITSQAQAIIQQQIINPIQYTCNTQQQRAVPQGATQAMQFAPWQATFGPTGLPQGLTWAPGAIQSSALLTQGSQIFIRNPQPEQAGMFIHNTQPSAMAQHNQIASQQINKPNQGIEVGGGNVQSKTAIPKTFSAILPNSIGTQQFRPASSVSTQTGQTQTTVHQTIQIRAGTKVRTKNVCRMPNVATAQKADAGNQTKASTGVQVLQQKLVATTPNVIPQDNKMMKTSPIIGQPGGMQQPQQPLTQIQQMQNLFQEATEQKGQIVLSNGIQNGGDRAVMPVVSMPPGQMTPLMGNMIVQTVPGIAAVAPGIPVPAGQPVQGVPIAQEIMTASSAITLNPSIKSEMTEQKDVGVQENGCIETGPGRPGDENSSGSEECLAIANSLVDGTRDRSQSIEFDDSVQDKLSEERDNEKKPEKEGTGPGQTKATMMVKPQVLTHVIEGFVIQESSEPFPVNRSVADGLIRKIPMGDGPESGEPPVKKPLLEDGKEAANEENKVNPMKWTVAEVCEFIRNLPGCAEYVEDFAMQDIDGEALMLLKADHLTSAMSMKLGPAVKIIAKIDSMRANATVSKEGADRRKVGKSAFPHPEYVQAVTAFHIGLPINSGWPIFGLTEDETVWFTPRASLTLNETKDLGSTSLQAFHRRNGTVGIRLIGLAPRELKLLQSTSSLTKIFSLFVYLTFLLIHHIL